MYIYVIYIYLYIYLYIYIYIYTEYSHPKLNCHILLIFHPYNALLPFFTLFIDLCFNILISPQHKILSGHCCMLLLCFI